MRMPVLFLAHGTPMNALEENHITADWKSIAADCAQPSAIVLFSAHWHVPGWRITANKKPETIHDFSGFPKVLYQQNYPCQGDPELANRLSMSLNKAGFHAETDHGWGLDHGSWVLLKHLYPDASIPVLQISMDSSTIDLEHHYRVAEVLRPFREEGVLFIGSGNIVHNIAKWIHARPGDSIEWAVSFDKAIGEAIGRHDIQALFNYRQLEFAREAVPTIEHYLPLIYCMGLVEPAEERRSSQFGFQDLSTACSRSVRFG